MNNWYKNLKTAPWSPPPYVFGIVWPILYIFLIISVSLVLFNKQCFPYCSPITYFTNDFEFILDYYFLSLSTDIAWLNNDYFNVRLSNNYYDTILSNKSFGCLFICSLYCLVRSSTELKFVHFFI